MSDAYSPSLPHGDVDDADRVPTCPACGEVAQYEECIYCDGHGHDGLYQRCVMCDGEGGHYYCTDPYCEGEQYEDDDRFS